MKDNPYLNQEGRGYIPPERRLEATALRESRQDQPWERWRITDTDVPFSNVLNWFIKMTMPILIWVALATTVGFFVVNFWVGVMLRAALGELKENPEMQSKLERINPFAPKPAKP